MTHKEIRIENKQVMLKLYGIRIENLALAIATLRREECQVTTAKALGRLKEVAGELTEDQLGIALTLADVSPKTKKLINKYLTE